MFEENPEGMVVANGMPIFRDSGLVDWVSYADAVVATSIIAETQNEIPPDVAARGERYVARTISGRIDEILWQPEHSTAELFEKGTIDMLVLDLALQEGRLTPVSNWNSPRLEVGGRYVMPLVKFDRSWAPMTAESPLPVEGSAVAAADAAAWDAMSPAADELAGKSFERMEATIEATEPDPVAARYFDLPPEERVKAVANSGSEQP